MTFSFTLHETYQIQDSNVWHNQNVISTEIIIIACCAFLPVEENHAGFGKISVQYWALTIKFLLNPLNDRAFLLGEQKSSSF